MKYVFYIFAILAVLMVSACAWPGPHIHQPNAFDRNAASYKQVPEDIDEVVICYNSQGTGSQQVKALAAAECGKYGKTALFQKHLNLTCPMFTPSSAEFACLKR